MIVQAYLLIIGLALIVVGLILSNGTVSISGAILVVTMGINWWSISHRSKREKRDSP
jgi:hypothetical protein